MSARSPRSDRWLLAGVVVLCLALKTLFLLARADVFFYGEELEKGAAAKAILARLDLPYHELAYHHYEGGGFAVSHLKALAFLAVGESVLAHKLVALAFCVAVLAVGMGFVARRAGTRPAALFGALFVLGPESFQKLVLLDLGIHFEATLFLLLVLGGAARLVLERAPPRPGALFALGLATGLGIWFSYQIVLAAGYAALLVLWRRRDLLAARASLAGLAGLVLGLAPLSWMASRVGAGVLDIHGTGLAEGGDSIARLAAFLRSLYAPPSAGALLYPLAWLAALALGLSSPRRELRAATLYLGGFLLFWSAAYASSAFVVGELRHHFQMLRFAPFVVVATALAAVALGGALADGAGGRRRLAAVVALALFAGGLLGSARILAEASPARMGEGARALATLKGYDYEGWLAKLWPRLDDPPQRRLALLAALDPGDRALLYPDLATVAYRDSELSFAAILDELRALDPEHWRLFVPGLGGYAVRRAGGDLAAALRASEGLEPEIGELLAEGIGRAGRRYRGLAPAAMEAELAGLLELPRTQAYLRGLGHRIVRRLVLGPWGGVEHALRPAAARALVERQPEAARAALRQGLEEALALHRL